MPERLDHVRIPLSRELIDLPWDSRSALLGELRHDAKARPTIDAFEAVGASRPVRLTREHKALLLDAINVWSTRVTVDGLPPGVWDLRNALDDDLHDRAAQ
jgi:hypothetical protein